MSRSVDSPEEMSLLVNDTRLQAAHGPLVVQCFACNPFKVEFLKR